MEKNVILIALQVSAPIKDIAAAKAVVFRSNMQDVCNGIYALAQTTDSKYAPIFSYQELSKDDIELYENIETTVDLLKDAGFI